MWLVLDTFIQYLIESFFRLIVFVQAQKTNVSWIDFLHAQKNHISIPIACSFMLAKTFKDF